MTPEHDLTDHFLIAMPGLQDPNFSRTLTYICEHGEQGAMGIVVNRPTPMKLGEMLDQLDIAIEDPAVGELPLYWGGPVQPERGFVLHSGDSRWDATLVITPEVSITTSRDILQAIARGEGPAQSLIALGYAGWGAGQLETELSSNAWLSGPADQAILFELPAEARWQAAASLLGVDLNLISGAAGHA